MEVRLRAPHLLRVIPGESHPFGARRAPAAAPSVRSGMSTVQTDAGWASLFQKAFAQSQNAMLMVDEERRVVDANPAFARLVGRRRSTLLGRHVYDFIPGGP